LARGLANYSSTEARLLCKKSTAELADLIGYQAEPEMVHKNNMVLAQEV
jgi:glutamate 5-kinase